MFKISRHKIKRKGEKFYPMYRDGSTMWLWKKYHIINDWVAPESEKAISDDYGNIYFKNMKDVMAFVDRYKVIKSKDNYKLWIRH